ncbi:MAG: hypothetical protein WD934_09790 [Gemmatimonadales bacterium]
MRTLFIALFVAVPLAAQAPVRLDRPEAEFAEAFSSLIGLRELPDGRVIIADRLEQTVALLDFRTGNMTMIGRQGSGPGEFGTPGQLFQWTGDTTMMLDLANRRGMLIAASGTVSSNTVQFSGNGLGALILPRAVDRQERLYGLAPLSFGGGGPASVPDSLPVIRWSPTGRGADTLFYVPVNAGGAVTVRVGAGGAASAQGRRRAFVPAMQWVVTPDGRVAQVLPEPYHVRWLGGARPVAGPTVSYQPVRITQRDREAWADQAGTGQAIMRGPQGTQTMRVPRPNLDEVDFPEVKPPFEAVFATPDGEVWVRVSRPATATRQLYDVFNGQSQRVRQVELAEGRRLVGFGNGTLYAVRIDEDDLQWLERYRR